ncbi:solute carrier family 23 protein, partial [Campylobacter jejuni]
FGLPMFNLPASIAMCLVMMTVMIESFGMFMAAGQMVGRPVDRRQLVRGLRGDAAGTVLGGVFNTFPYTSFAQNIGLLSITGVRSRFVCAGA